MTTPFPYSPAPPKKILQIPTPPFRKIVKTGLHHPLLKGKTMIQFRYNRPMCYKTIR